MVIGAHSVVWVRIMLSGSLAERRESGQLARGATR